VGADSSVGITTRFGLGGPGNEFPHPSRSVLGPTQPPIQCVSGGKAVAAWRWITYSHLAPRLQKKYGYISPPSLDIRGLF